MLHTFISAILLHNGMKQTVSKQVQNKDRRSGKARVIALSRRIYKLTDKNTYYVESETCDNRYYFVRYNPDVFEWCSCKDFESNRSERCKHTIAIEYAIRFNTIREVDKLPSEVLKITRNLIADTYKNESIATLNELEKAEIEAEEYRTQRVLTYEQDDYSF